MSGIYDLTEFYRSRIEAMSKKIGNQDKTIVQLATLIFELCDKDCPEEYKNVALGEARKSLDED